VRWKLFCSNAQHNLFTQIVRAVDRLSTKPKKHQDFSERFISTYFLTFAVSLDFVLGFSLEYTPRFKKWGHIIFLNNSVKRWPILIIFGMQHQKGEVNDCSLAYLTLILSLHYLVKCWSRCWPFATMNSYWVVYALTQKITGTRKSLHIWYLFNTNNIYFNIFHRRIEMTNQQRASCSGSFVI